MYQNLIFPDFSDVCFWKKDVKRFSRMSVFTDVDVIGVVCQCASVTHVCALTCTSASVSRAPLGPAAGSR